MRILNVLLFGVALALPQVEAAQSSISNTAFGKSESILDLCTKTNPTNAANFEKLRKELAEQSAGKDLSEVRKTQEYKDAYLKEKNEFTKIPREKASEFCSAMSKIQ